MRCRTSPSASARRCPAEQALGRRPGGDEAQPPESELPLTCPGGDPESGDDDDDRLCDDVDPCVGPDNNADADDDGWCDSRDACLGDDAFGDADGDDLCDDGRDPCIGVDNVDGDADGVCDDLDLCDGIQDNGDGTCTAVIAAAIDPDHAGLLGNVDGGSNYIYSYMEVVF